ncbi:hypothetical protein P153DRAFT_344505 [Dothidotthia symphoricarpi CBS 119687]|uniref:Uncharacterized protein n=1 Tax=Dothidotthia symphoricarpi CBS 119687 TaxID=1392245 RepID=A0A6A6A7D5_9PLEO|nr:uncharacterized protein P153DRAFT_344505 [Dothidotthia symphoricarpi CBS 119687]KAF2127145.1 hypothetical protein P153DRAFT_344505 [Dothidotthia symphoricarpi CBS 119687]
MAEPTTSTPGLFSRRPSFFGGPKTKGHQQSQSQSQSRSSVTHPHQHPHARITTPPTLTVPGQLPTSPPDALLPTPRKRSTGSRHSLSSSVADLGSSLRRSRSNSVRTSHSASSSSHTRTPSATLALSFSPEKAPALGAAPAASRPALSIATFARNKQKSSENVRPDGLPHYEKSPLSAVDKPKTMAAPAMAPRHPPSQKDILHANRQNNATLAPAAPISLPNGAANPNIIFQHIHETASKRISTLDYLRKAHEGRIYWFNTLLFSKTDLTRLPSFTTRNQARRAAHYLLLGFSLPTILDLHPNSPAEYLRTLNALLLEFEQYQSIHPADGSTPSSLSRARIPHMFKRANLGGKGRRSSSAAGDFPTLSSGSSFMGELPGGEGTTTTDDLLPNESYTHLQTPSLPFDPDFFSTFATLCDVLIDCYTRILSMLSTPESVALAGGGAPSIAGDMFNKADARVRKIILAGVVREFEESCRAGLRSEVGGVGKVVLGGLM